jgi:hypothetical protein
MTGRAERPGWGVSEWQGEVRVDALPFESGAAEIHPKRLLPSRPESDVR